MSAEIQSMLVLSTAHLTEETCNNHLHTTTAVSAYEKMSYGWFVYAKHSLDRNLPEDLTACVHRAKDCNAEWIMFDRDGPELEGLPIYDW